VSETVTKKIGAISVVYIRKPSPDSNAFSGNVSFGIHQTHADHYLEYKVR
jgi:hypothetical protein